ncbi:uncharacterized protein LOC130704126 [Daphnia carinata]|uniref:uncharacterized protein LOC130704126 n=1 Tax=Daphnia carinata TaxID=120202 RepID=UPI00257D3E86|nr:uncharacterized protein LOC130704126 [Daphnia carinata]
MSANCLEVDQAAYITLEAALKALNPEVIQQIHSVESIIASVDKSLVSKQINFNKTGNKGIFMGIWVNQLYYNNTQSYKLTIDEISENGTVGSRYFLTLHSKSAEEWHNNATVKSITKGVGKGLIIFQHIPYQIKSQNIEFHMIPSANGPWMKVLNYFSSYVDAKSEQYVYTPLFDAEKFMAVEQKQKMKCHLYGVIHSIIFKPKEGKQGKGQGMYVIVDPSCYENMIKQREYCMHVFSSSLAAFPKIEIGDIIRLHRAWAEIRPRDGLTDFRVFREDDLVVFPWNDEEKPRCSAGRFTFTKEDVEHVKYLKNWSLERYRQQKDVQRITEEAKNRNPITLSDIKPNENFNLPCRVVSYFAENHGVAIWVEDGTRCSLTTISDANIAPYDSQQTQVVDQGCSRICIRCSKHLLGTIKLEPQMFLYLRDVAPTVQMAAGIDITQFEIKGDIEVLPLNTRYHISLTQRLEKVETTTEAVQMGTLEVGEDIMELDDEMEQHPPENRPIGEESVGNQPGKDFASSPAIETADMVIDPIPHPIQPAIAQNAKDTTDVQKDHIASSGEGSTDRAMKEIPSDFFDPFSPPRQELIRQDYEREKQRLRRLIDPAFDELAHMEGSPVISRPLVKSQNLASLEDMTFSQVVASTQKPPRFQSDTEESNDADESSFSTSLEIRNAQPILSPAESPISFDVKKGESQNLSQSPAFQKHSRDTRSASRSISPHPAFRAVNEVLEIKTNCRSKADDLSESENQMNTSIDVPLFRTRPSKGDQIIVTAKARAKKTKNKQVAEIVTFDNGQQEELVLFGNQSKIVKESMVEKKNAGKMTDSFPRKKRRDSGGSSSSDSIVEIVQENCCEEMSQESDMESIVILDPLSQMDLEKIFCAVEEAHFAKKYLQNLEEMNIVQPGDRFRITARICELLPKACLPASDDPVGLKSLIVAFCLECRHLWQYNQFIDSVSERVWQPRTQPSASSVEDGETENVVINYLCSREDHARNIRMLIDGSSSIDDYEFDENIFLDRSYDYICPLCNSNGISHSLCTLKPSFFFRVHATQLIEKINSQNSTCIHILASGIHAEYFFGTKADHVLRSKDIWNRAEQRISKLVQNQQPLTLGLLRCQDNPSEILLEFTKNVFAVNHLLPW